MIGVILCSGKGSKLWPFCDWWQKCCIPIINMPNLINIVEQLKKLNLSKIYVAASYNAQMVKYVLSKKPHILIKEESNPDGTARSLINCIGEENEDLFVVYGDVVVDDRSIGAVYDSFKEKGCPCMLVQKIKADERSIDWICAAVEDGHVQGIYGHPRSHYVNARSAGVFALNRDIIRYLTSNPGYMENVCVGGMPPKEPQLEQSLQMMIDDGFRIAGVEVIGYCTDIDKPWHILEANRIKIDEIFASLTGNIIEEDTHIDPSAAVHGRIRLGRGGSIGKNVIIKGDIWNGENTSIDSGAIIEDKVVIGNNAKISDYSKIDSYTTIGNKNRIGYSAEVQGVTFDGVSIIHNTQIFGVIGSYVDIGAGCLTGTLRFDDAQTIPRIKGRSEFAGAYSNDVYIGDHTRTGVGDIFFPGVKIGINCAIWPGAIIDEDIKSNSLVIVEQNKTMKYWGHERYGW